MKGILTVIAFTTCSQMHASGFPLQVNPWQLTRAIEQKENPTRNLSAVGDPRMRFRAYGLLQIREPYLRDVNKIAGSKMIRRVWHEKWLTLRDMKNPKKAAWVLRVYLSHYGKLYREETGRVPTIAVYARIHNGGPDGWRKWDTIAYAQDVVRYARLYRVHHQRV
jgi:hypothetical protein